MRLGSARHLGEDPTGTWTLTITDEIVGADPVHELIDSLDAWSIKVYGHGEGFDPEKRKPTIDSVQAGPEDLTVLWSAPLQGDAPDTYKVQWKEHAGSWENPKRSFRGNADGPPGPVLHHRRAYRGRRVPRPGHRRERPPGRSDDFGRSDRDSHRQPSRDRSAHHSRHSPGGQDSDSGYIGASPTRTGRAARTTATSGSPTTGMEMRTYPAPRERPTPR